MEVLEIFDCEVLFDRGVASGMFEAFSSGVCVAKACTISCVILKMLFTLMSTPRQFSRHTQCQKEHTQFA